MRGAWRAGAAALALTSAVCLVMWGAQSTTEPGDAVVTSGPTLGIGSSHAASPPARRASHRTALRPVALRIPSIGVSTPLTKLGLQQDGTVEVPSDPDVAGWYRRGPVPGALGSSVILGHVDSLAGPAVFYRLSDLHAGSLIMVRLDDGATARFTVHSIRVYPNADFPARRVYGGHGHAELNLVTCGGSYDAARGGYQANVVVNARRA